MANLSKAVPKRNDVDMTVGSISGRIIKFSLPLLAGNLFQQLYNMVDTWVIGQTENNAAYAAVGSVGPIINMLIGAFMGLASGAGVVISQYYGAKNDEKVKDAVHTSMLLTFILCVVFTVVGILITPFALDIMLKGKDDAAQIYPEAKSYLTIYFAGVAGLLIYNMGSGILRAVGDSRRPFYYLVVSALINIALDLLFVNKFGMTANGVALATIIAQGVSAILIMITLLRTRSVVRLSFASLRMSAAMLKSVVRIGIPAAIQMALTAFSNIFVQSYISGANGNAEVLLGGWTTYSKIDQFIFLPVQSISLAVTTFVGQNLGVNDVKRAKKGTMISYLIATGVTALIIIVVISFRKELAMIFNKSDEVVATAVQLLTWITPFYLFCCVNQVFSASLRGAGDTKAPMLIMIMSFVVFRQIYLYVITNAVSNDIIPVALGYPAGWFVCAVTTIVYYKLCKFGKHRLMQ